MPQDNDLEHRVTRLEEWRIYMERMIGTFEDRRNFNPPSYVYLIVALIIGFIFLALVIWVSGIRA
jgi:hypothetical protein